VAIEPGDLLENDLSRIGRTRAEEGEHGEVGDIGAERIGEEFAHGEQPGARDHDDLQCAQRHAVSTHWALKAVIHRGRMGTVWALCEPSTTTSIEQKGKTRPKVMVPSGWKRMPLCAA
jgi:hypothetical protein